MRKVEPGKKILCNGRVYRAGDVLPPEYKAVGEKKKPETKPDKKENG